MSTFNVTTAADSGAGSLRSAIAQVNVDTTPGIITFDPAVTSITLASQLTISKPVTITGGGTVTISGGGTNRIFNIDDGSATAPLPSR